MNFIHLNYFNAVKYLKMLSKNDKISYVLTIMNGLIPFIIISQLLRYNDLNFAGEYFMALSISGATQLFVDYGFNISAMRSFAVMIESNAKNEEIMSVFFSIILSKLLIAAILISFILIYILLFSPLNGLYVLTCVCIGAILSVTNMTPLIFALKKSIYLSGVTFITRILFIFPLLTLSLNLFTIVAITLLPIFISNIYTIVVARNNFRIKFKENKLNIDIFKQLSVGGANFLNSILAALISTSWPFLLSNLISPAELGAYGISEKVVRGLMSLVTPVQSFIIANNKKLGLFDVVKKFFGHKIYRLLGLCIIALVFGLTCLPAKYIQFILGKSIGEYRIMLNIYIYGFLLYFFDTLLYTLMVVEKREGRYAPIVVLSFFSAYGISYLLGLSIYTPLFYEALVTSFLIWITLGRSRNKELNK